MRNTAVTAFTLFTAVFTRPVLANDDLALAKHSLPWPVHTASVKDSSTLFRQRSNLAVSQSCYQQGLPAGSAMGAMPWNLGLDIATPADTEVFAVAPGVVRAQGQYDNGRYYVVVESEQMLDARNNVRQKWTTLYANLAASDLIANGSIIAADPAPNLQRIGRVMAQSDNGAITHLHLGMRASEFSAAESALVHDCASLHGFVDPLDYLQGKQVLVIDNRASGNTRQPETWEVFKPSVSQSNSFIFGPDYEALAADQAISFSFAGIIKQSGRYTVYARWPVAPGDGSSRDNAATFTLRQNYNQYRSNPLDQADNQYQGRWVPVFADLDLIAGNVTLVLESASRQAGKKIVADAVLLEQQ